MERNADTDAGAKQAYSGVGSFLRRALFSVLSAGPMPDHIAFIMDGNRRYAKKKNLAEGTGHGVGFSALTTMLKYCFEMGVKYVTAYAFSIENFKRSPLEVQSLMVLMQRKMEELMKEESLVNQYGVRVHFAGNLKLLNDSVREAAERIMAATAKNNNAVLSICVAYTSTDEITHAIQETCDETWDRIQEQNAGDACSCSNGVVEIRNDQLEHIIDLAKVRHNQSEQPIYLDDIEKHMYLAVAPDPDIIIRTSGETRLSNFLLWQSKSCLLYSPFALWPEIGLRHLLWAVMNFQRNHAYLDKKKKQL